MKILITCPRAPVTIEWIRIFNKNRHEVILVDSVSFPIAKYYNNTKFIQVPSPRLAFEEYKEAMSKLIKEVDWVISNCEDIFYLIHVRDSIKTDTFFFMPPSDLLFTMHHKFEFFSKLNSHVKFPETKLITKKTQISLDKNKILKPVFSRFGRSVILDINSQSIAPIEISSVYPWVEQERIEGKSICNYALLLDGEVLAHVAYEPMYMLNGAAATYFKAYEDERLDNFIKQFAKDNNYTGQVAFDFIDDGDDLYVLECNPRATSGLHIMSEGLAFVNNTFSYDKKYEKNAYRVGSALYAMFGVHSLLKGELKTLQKDYNSSVDVMKGVPLYGQILYVLAMVFRAIRHRKSITEASTFDMEFDG